MKRWAPIFHFYQPPRWEKAIIERVVIEGYRKFTGILKARPEFRCSVNLTGSLTEQLLRHGFTDVVDDFRAAAERGQVELIGSALYHPILALIPPEEAVRQIERNEAVNRAAFGKAWHPTGFWIPELCYSDPVATALRDRGYEWIVVDPVVVENHLPEANECLVIQDVGLRALIRNRAVSDGFFIPAVSTAAEFIAHVNANHDASTPLVTAIDGENIGHHRKSNEQMLDDLITSGDFTFVTGSELIGSFPERCLIKLRPGSWASQVSEIERGVPYVLWNDPDNRIHAAQWELLMLVRETVLRHEGDPGAAEARQLLDERLMSDQFWWASAKPWWDAAIVLHLVELLADVPQHLKLTDDERGALRTQEETVVKLVRRREETGEAERVRAEYLRTYVTYMYMAGKKIS
jgi:predicted glycosyl hydrolase (DUF1957 family)